MSESNARSNLLTDSRRYGDQSLTTSNLETFTADLWTAYYTVLSTGILRANWAVSTGRAVVQGWSSFWEKPVVNPLTTTMAVEHLDSGNDSILILFWTEYFSQPFTATSEHRMIAQQALDNCPVKNCVLTNQRDLVNRSAAVIFHIRELADRPDKSVPSFRSPNQYYVFYLLESPPHTNMMLDEYEGFFNLTSPIGWIPTFHQIITIETSSPGCGTTLPTSRMPGERKRGSL